MPTHGVGNDFSHGGHDDHGNGVCRVYDGDDEGHALGRDQLGDKRYALGEQRARYRADEDTGSKKHLVALGYGRHEIAQAEQCGVDKQKSIALKATRRKGKQRSADGVGEGEQADELSDRGNRDAKPICEVGLDADDDEFGASERKGE